MPAWHGDPRDFVCPPSHPTSLGDVWVGVTQPRFGSALCTCRFGGLVGCSAHAYEGSRADFDVVPPYVPPLSESDVERIARRVVELLKAT